MLLKLTFCTEELKLRKVFNNIQNVKKLENWMSLLQARARSASEERGKSKTVSDGYIILYPPEFQVYSQLVSGCFSQTAQEERGLLSVLHFFLHINPVEEGEEQRSQSFCTVVLQVTGSRFAWCCVFYRKLARKKIVSAFRGVLIHTSQFG